MKILIAENDRDVLKQYANLLKPRGHDVILTDNGEDCLIAYNDEFRNVSDRTDIREHRNLLTRLYWLIEFRK